MVSGQSGSVCPYSKHSHSWTPGMDITVCGREGPLHEWCPLFTIMTAGGHIFRVSLLPCDVVLGVQSFSHYHLLHRSW